MKQIKLYDMILKQTICKNLSFCLRKQTLSWHLIELNMIQWAELKVYDDINETYYWINIFLKQFKNDSIAAQLIIFQEQYIINDVTHHHEFKKYVNHIIHNDKSVNLSSFNEMIAIWIDIAVKFHYIILMIFIHFFMSNFLNIINAVKID